ncbi:MAG: hypothetical protein U1F63_06250 [Chitinivorax sp.]|jgi:hypothetical protein
MDIGNNAIESGQSAIIPIGVALVLHCAMSMALFCRNIRRSPRFFAPFSRSARIQ